MRKGIVARALRLNLAFALLLGLLSVTGLTACNTLEGAGDDLEKAGDKIEDAVE